MDRNDLANFLGERRSASILAEPKPDQADVERILQIAGTVPDHGSLKPYRFVVVQGESREQFANSLVNAYEEVRGQTEEPLRAKLKAKAYAAPLQIILIFSPIDSAKIPAWEQMAAAACTGYACDLAANALGFGAVWKNFAYEPGSDMKNLFRLQPHEKVLGWINIGTETQRQQSSRSPMDLKKHALFL